MVSSDPEVEPEFLVRHPGSRRNGLVPIGVVSNVGIREQVERLLNEIDRISQGGGRTRGCEGRVARQGRQKLSLDKVSAERDAGLRPDGLAILPLRGVKPTSQSVGKAAEESLSNVAALRLSRDGVENRILQRNVERLIPPHGHLCKSGAHGNIHEGRDEEVLDVSNTLAGIIVRGIPQLPVERCRCPPGVRILPPL